MLNVKFEGSNVPSPPNKCLRVFAKANFLKQRIKADFLAVELFERAEILLLAGENLALKLNR